MAKKINFTQKQIEYIINKYVNEKIPSTKIAKEFGCTYGVITRVLRENNVQVKDFRLDKFKSIKDEVINMYNSGISLTKIGEKFNVDRHFLSKHLKELGIEIVNRQNETKFNENVFDSIDTEEKAYWLGFIFADGYISSRDNGFELSLKVSDIEHLNKFNKFMNHNKNNVKIGLVKCNERMCFRCRWGVVNAHLWNTLNNYGCTPRKSLTLEFPNLNIFKESNLIIHFIRGYFDGDGCLSYVKSNHRDENSNYTPIVSFEGSESFLSELEKQLGYKGYVTKHTNHITLSFSTKKSIEIINLIYSNSTIYLDRKFNRYNFFKNGCRSAKELAELLASENGENCDVNPVLTEEIKESSVV